MSYFSKLKKALKIYMGKSQIAIIHDAYLLAEQSHAPQIRQSGEPYIIHPVAVATTLAGLRMDAETIIAALLHDVIEDTPVEKEEIIEKFGSSVAELVDGVSKLTQMSFANKAEAQAHNFQKMILAMSKDLRVILVKLADRLHNMQTLDCVSSQKRKRVAKETIEIYTPLANRLGMHELRIELEDLCFQALYPFRYQVLSHEVKQIRGVHKEVMGVIMSALKNTCEIHKLAYLKIYGREKHLYSIYRKMKERGLSLDKILDVYAFRIVVDNIEDCYRVIGYAHNLYKPVPERFKDYIAIPKANGYQSLHTTLFGPYGIPIEIQVRTRRMHEMAANGIAAHWLYKSHGPVDTEARMRAQAWVNNLVELQRSTENSMDFVEHVKIDLFPEEVYVFTPKGDIYQLPVGSTAIDFAYALHSDIGNKCIACRVDRQYSLLTKPLRNGQTVEIICADGTHPNQNWLEFAVTAKARTEIRNYFKKESRHEFIELGKLLLEKALRKLNLTMGDIPEGRLEQMRDNSQLASVDELYEKIGLGHINARVVARGLFEHEQGELVEIERFEPLMIQGTEGLVLHFATCCYPVPGEPILGKLESGRGMVVHRQDCEKVIIPSAKKHSPYFPLCWTDQPGKTFTVALEIFVNNDLGVLSVLTQKLAVLRINIEDFYLKGQSEHEKGIIFKVRVEDRKQLTLVMAELSKVNQVHSVLRYRESR